MSDASSRRGRPSVKRTLRRRLGAVKWAVLRGWKAARNPPRAEEPTGLHVLPGVHVDPAAAGDLPVAVISLWDVPGDRVGEVVDEVARAQVATMAFRPLFVTRSDDFTVFRRHGYLFEYVMPLAEWCRVNDPARWPRFVEDRFADIAATFRPRHTVTLSLGPDETAADAMDRLLPLLTAR